MYCPPLTPEQRTTWAATWATTVWEVFRDPAWGPLPTTGSWVLISAWNPGGIRLSDSINRARDVVLHGELHAVDCTAQRSRGRAADNSWCEDGWMLPRPLDDGRHLLRRYGQFAGLLIVDGHSSLVWADDETSNKSDT